MAKKTVRDIDVRGKRVLLRADLNVPFRPGTTEIADDSRIRAILPTLAYLREQGARVLLSSHLGRPKGVQEEWRLSPVARRLGQLLGWEVLLTRDCVGPEAEAAAARLRPGEVVLLENLRFHPEEEANDPMFAQALAALADVYVNDAFGAAHRAHASTEGIARYRHAVAGLLMERELEIMGQALAAPEHPFAALVGGAKVSEKIAILQNLIPRTDHILIGGGMATAFLQAYGHPVGASLAEKTGPEMAREVLRAAARQGGVEILLPLDVVVAPEARADAEAQVVFADRIPEGAMALDIGPRTIEMFQQALLECKTILWNGPMGRFEYEPFAAGTRAMAQTLAQATDQGAVTIIGGGSTVEAIETLGLTKRLTHVSTGGGATLEFLEGRTLPGVAALEEK